MEGRVLVLGDDSYRGKVSRALEAAGLEVVDCDPRLGDCVMYAKLESIRYDAFVFVGWDSPVTRGALALVAERAVLIPVLDAEAQLDTLQDGYLFRLPCALGVRSTDEASLIDTRLPKAQGVVREIVGDAYDEPEGLVRLVERATGGTWQWADVVEQLAAELRDSG